MSNTLGKILNKIFIFIDFSTEKEYSKVVLNTTVIIVTLIKFIAIEKLLGLKR